MIVFNIDNTFLKDFLDHLNRALTIFNATRRTHSRFDLFRSYSLLGFMSAESDEHEKEKLHSHFNPLRKRLVLGMIIDMRGEAAK